MIFKSLVFNNKVVKFDQSSTLIWSEKNSVGKTTLIRLLLHALGYKIPGTKKFKFNNVVTELNFENKENEYVYIRDKKIITVFQNSKKLGTFHTENDLNELLAIAFGIENNLILENILGLYYFDQEKGWTLLNRGIVIGSNRFSIEKLLEGMTGKQLGDMRADIENLTKEIKNYNQIKSLIIAKEKLKFNQDKVDWTSVDDLENKLSMINFTLNRLRKSLSELEISLKDNDKFKNMINNLKLMVKDERGNLIQVTSDTLVNFEINQAAIRARIANNVSRIDEAVKEKRKIEKELSNLEMFKIENQIQRISNVLTEAKLSSQLIDDIIQKLSIEKGEKSKYIKKILNSSEIITSIYERIGDYAAILNVDKYIDSTEGFLFTSNLKEYTGAVLHLIVFSFRLSLLKELEIVTGERLPIIIDSPKSGELDTNNLKSMFKLLNLEFSKNQIIVVTAENLLTMKDWGQKIKMETSLMEDLPSNKFM